MHSNHQNEHWMINSTAPNLAKLDRDVARSFLQAPTTTITYQPIPMKTEYAIARENPSETFQQRHHSPSDPIYCDLIIDTVTDYDIFYPIARETRRYYSDSMSDRSATIPILPSSDQCLFPRYNIARLDELSVSMDLPYDYEWTTATLQNRSIDNEREPPMKNVRFNDHSYHTNHRYSSISSYQEEDYFSSDQYYFHRQVSTPFLWFRPVINHNYAICIPHSRPSLHAYLTPAFNPVLQWIPSSVNSNSTRNSIRL